MIIFEVPKLFGKFIVFEGILVVSKIEKYFLSFWTFLGCNFVNIEGSSVFWQF